MQEFLTTLLSFPTVAFTGLMTLVLLYWLVVIFGALDLDFLDSMLGLDAAEGALDGAIEALDGVADGALDGAADALDGAADGALDAAEGAADAADAADMDAADGARQGAVSGFMNALGVRGVPITIVGSFILFWAWVLSYLFTRFLGPVAASLIVSLFLGAAAMTGALFLGALTARPFRGLFNTETARGRASLVGKMCIVTSSRVDKEFGRVEIDDGAAGIVVEARCPSANNLTRGSSALVFRYEPADGIYYIGPVDEAIHEAARLTKEE